MAVKILKEKYRGQEGPNFDFDAEKEILAKLPSVRLNHLYDEIRISMQAFFQPPSHHPMRVPPPPPPPPARPVTPGYRSRRKTYSSLAS